MDTLKKRVFAKQRLYEKPGGKVRPCPREDSEGDHFWRKVFSKMTHNLVFAGQPRRTATLPQNGHGARLETWSG